MMKCVASGVKKIMTPEALHTYLIRCRFSEDVVQGIIEDYLKKQPTIHHPKSWGYIAAKRDQMKEEQRVNVYRGELCIPSNRLTPERYAIARQELARAMQTLRSRRGKPPEGGWIKAWKEDYETLQREKTG